jgi:hypothetical protein
MTMTGPDRRTKREAPDSFCAFHTPEGAYYVMTVDIKTMKIVRAGIYSTPFQGLTSVNLSGEIMLNGPSMPGNSYNEATLALEAWMHEHYPHLDWTWK